MSEVRCRSCFRRLFISASWPIALVILAVAGFAGAELTRECAGNTPTPRGSHAALRDGLQSALPLVLVLSFIVVPTISTIVFKTFLCVTFEYDTSQGLTQRYHSVDLEMRRERSALAAT